MKKYEWEVKLMAFLDELSKKFTDVSRIVTRKAKEVTDIGGLKIQIADEKRKVNKLYENLGRRYFELCKDAPNEEVADLVNHIKAGIARVNDLEEEIVKVEAESAAKAEAERVLRDAEAAAKKESVAEAEMREIHEEAPEEATDTVIAESGEDKQEETPSGEPEAAPEEPTDGAEANTPEAGSEEAADEEETKTEE